MTILTVDEAADFLKMTKSQLYTLCRTRSRKRMARPIPVIKVLTNLRFSKESLERWLRELEAE
jgi:helix-turn-helix protein